MNYKNLYNIFPVCIFLAIWTVIGYLHQMGMFGIYVVSNPAKLILFSGLYAFVLGYFFVHVNIQALKVKFSGGSFRKENGFILNDSHFLIIFLCGCLIVFVGIIIVLKSFGEMIGGLELYLKNPFKVRHQLTEYSMSGSYNLIFALGNYLMNFNPTLCVLGGVLFTVKSKKRYFAFFPLIFALMISLIYLSRGSVLKDFCFWIFSFFLTISRYPEKDRKRLIMSFMKILLFMGGLFGVVFWFILRLRAFYIKDFGKFICESIYQYSTGGIAGFETFIQSDPDFKYGLSGFRTIFKWLSRVGLWVKDDVMKVNNPFMDIGGGKVTNTFTYVKTLYEDFGIVGVLIGSFAWGGGTRYCLKKLDERFTLLRVLIVATLTYSIVMSFFAFYLEAFTGILYSLLITLLFDKILISTKSISVK